MALLFKNISAIVLKANLDPFYKASAKLKALYGSD